ncbi:hypothetical protein [Thiothrix fructosivorans]|uniref:Uncharacterized protein n=1 Tax=Thiothrix fructosivorans TaxID=111770 RepID=A0A8B0SJH0_9GAMM|nr:hypothetical protein [Thiothrix fructosivorans]MBO0613858.1 hypothetical protein [Thiothrix fructosivorans]QTX10228.1 hypothetical protein J1836_016800 [Thiothrix fructosivorans]
MQLSLTTTNRPMPDISSISHHSPRRGCQGITQRLSPDSARQGLLVLQRFACRLRGYATKRRTPYALWAGLKG